STHNYSVPPNWDLVRTSIKNAALTTAAGAPTFTLNTDLPTPGALFATHFYTKLFAISPPLASLFPSLSQQSKALGGMLETIIKKMQNGEIEVIKTAAYQLGRRHALYGVEEEMFGAVGEALVKTLREWSLGGQREVQGAWNEDVPRAWVAPPMSVGLVYEIRRRLAAPRPEPTSSSDSTSPPPIKEAPLHHVHAQIRIIDTVAHVSLQQHYSNPEHNTHIEAVYRFPLLEGVAIHAFEAVIDEKKRIVGKVKEKKEAREVYKEAVEKGKVASLLEQVSPDVYQASVGNIPPNGRVTIKISYICELKHDADTDQIRFVLPTAIAPRYGALPVFPRDSSSAATENKTSSVSDTYFAFADKNYLTVDIACQMGNAISSVESPSHLIKMHLGRDTKEEVASAAFDPSKACVEFTSKDVPLTKDFVLIIKSKDLDKPRCFFEYHPTTQTSSMMLTLVPRFALNDIPSELIFLVDRSGSMEGARINQTRQALQLFLRSIPPKNFFFNIVGFGTSYQTLFPKSVEYNQQNLTVAEKHVEGLDADLGGTEIAKAIEAIFKDRRRDMPTQVFVLTDGEVWDVERVLDLIRQNVGKEEDKTGNEKIGSFVRVFSLGIGDNVSHQLVEGMARVGKGFAQFVVEGERMEKKIMRQLKSALLPPMTNYSIKWVAEDIHGQSRDKDHPPQPTSQMTNSGDSRSSSIPDDKDAPPPGYAEATAGSPPTLPADDSKPEPAISLFSEDPNPIPPPASPVPPLPEFPRDFQEAPYKVPPLYPGSRFVVYCIIKNSLLPRSNNGVPEHVLIQGHTPDGLVELKVPVKLLANPFSMTSSPNNIHPDLDMSSRVLHTLAARKLIQDLEEETSYIHALLKKKPSLLTHPTHTVQSVVKAEIVRLAIEFNLASKFTSFVAVDEDEDSEVKKRVDSDDTKQKEKEQKRRVTPPPMIIQTQMAPAPTGAPPRPPTSTLAVPAPYSLMQPLASHGLDLDEDEVVEKICESYSSSDDHKVYALPPKSGRHKSRPPLFRHSFHFGFGSSSSYSSSSGGAGQWIKKTFGSLGFGAGKKVAKGGTGAGSPPVEPMMAAAISAPMPAAAVVSSATEKETGSHPTGPEFILQALVRLQNWDGSFPLSERFCSFVAPTQTLSAVQAFLSDIFASKSTDGNDVCHWATMAKEEKEEVECIWATCLAVVYCRKKLVELKEEWELVVGKAEGFVRAWGRAGGKISEEVVKGMWEKAEDVV
ncbi:hypothetical protein HK102_004801, partial [Quaeritorhiza haematococci]